MEFKSVDHVPFHETFEYWDETLERWWREGLPADVDCREYFGLEPYHQTWFWTLSVERESVLGKGRYVKNMDDWQVMKPYCTGTWEQCITASFLKKMLERQKNGEVIWVSVNGFFWFPRELFGPEGHFYSFYDMPEVIHDMNKTQVKFIKTILERWLSYMSIDFITIVEDMSYKSGSMISKEHFDEFMAAYYREIVPWLKNKKVDKIFIDSDGDFYELIDWFKGVGIRGFVPVEKRAGMDPVTIRKKHPDIMLIGGYDKTVVSKGEEAIVAEFENILPVIKQGAYVPSTDHQVPPDVSLENYKLYLKYLRQYCGVK